MFIDPTTGPSIPAVDYHDHGPNLTKASFSPDGRYILTASEWGTSVVYDTLNGKVLSRCDQQQAIIRERRIQGLKKPNLVWVRDAEFDPTGTVILNAGPFGNIWMWSLKAETCTQEDLAFLDRHTDDARTATFSHSGQLIVSSADDTTVKIIHLQDKGTAKGSKQITYDFSVANDKDVFITDAKFTPDEKSVIATRSDGLVARLRGFDFGLGGKSDHSNGTSTLKVEELLGSLKSGGDETYDNGAKAFFWQIALLENGNKMATASATGEVALWDISTARMTKIRVFNPPSAKRNGAGTIDVSSDGRLLVAGWSDGIARLYRVADGNFLAEYHVSNERAVSSVRFSRDVKWLVTASPDGRAKTWSLPE